VKIPNCSNAKVTESKILNYLLALDHPDGKSKAKFFLNWGFTRKEWTTFAAALFNQVNQNDYAEIIEGQYGTKYIVIAPILAPNGITIPIKTIWMIAKDEEFPQLITAYPAS